MSKSIVGNTKERQRIEAMARVFTKTDRVLSGNPINVTVEDSPYIAAPSWTDGKTITFNKGLIGNVTTVEDIIRLSGLNYHELAHVLYTPRSGTKVVKAIQDEGLHNAFNVLEDQRIETFLTSIYPSTIPYLVSTFVRYCIQSDSAWATNFTLMHGRRYLPSDIRREFRNRFVRQDLIPAFEAIIDEYRTLVYPADGDRGVELTREFQKLIDEIGGHVQDPHGHSTCQRPDINSGRPENTSSQRDAANAVADADKELEERDKEREEANASAGDSEDSDDDSDGQGSKGEDDSSEGDSESDGDSDQDSDGEGNGTAAGLGSGQQQPGDSDGDSKGSGLAGGNGANGDRVDLTEDQLRELLEQTVREYEQSDSVVEDVADKQRAIVNDGDGIGSSLDGKNYREATVWPEDVALVRRFASILERLSSDSDPGWESHASSGRINIRRVMEGAEYDELWDRWEDGNNDATDIECVIAIDTSGSMTYTIDQASRALWVIKRALETLDANVTVITYGNDSFVAYQRGDRASRTAYRRLAAAGTTHARPAVREAASILEASNRHNKIFISITDGQWNTESLRAGDKTSNELIKAMNGIGVTTAIAYLGHYYHIDKTNEYYSHNCKIVSSVDTPAKLIDFAKEIVSSTITPRKAA